LVGCLLLSSGYALASDISGALYYAIISIGNSGGTEATDVCTTADISTPSLIASGSSNTTATNMVMRNSTGADALFMPGYDTNPWVMWVESLPAHSYTNYLLYTAESTGGIIRYFPGTGGMTADDDASLELGDDFTIEQRGRVNTSAGADKNLLYKNKAFKIYVSDASQITAEMGTPGGNQSVRVGAGADDCTLRWDGTEWTGWSIGNDSMTAGYSTATFYKAGGGMRFQSLPISQGATIATANVTYTAKVNRASTVVRTRFTGEDVDDAATFSSLVDYQARRGTVVGGANDDYITTAQVDWDAIPAWTAETTYTSPELKTIVQEIVNRAGWASGNDMVIFWDDHDGRSDAASNCLRQGYSYVGSSTKAPLLYVSWGAENYVAVTANGIDSGEHIIKVTADGTNMKIYVDDIEKDSAALGGASTSDNDSNWAFLENNVVPYMDYHKIWVSGALKQHIEWEYDDEFTDQSGNGNHATPTFRTTSSDEDVSGTVISFLPVSEAKAPAFSLGDTPPWITEVPPVSGNFTTGIMPTFPGAEIITAVAEESDTPSQLPLTIIAGFTILAISLTVSGFTKRAGSNSLLLKSILIGSLMGIAIATNIMDFWMLLFFAIIAVALAMGSQQKGWV